MAVTQDFDGGNNLLSYERLQDRVDFRLIRPCAGEDNAPIRCPLTEHRLEQETGTYIALSYTWGDGLLCRSIECDGERAMVSRHLHSMLSRIRHISGDSVIWADALCIDQGLGPVSLQERSHQVSIMYRIFGNAKEVLIDVGDADEGPCHY